MFTKFEGPLHYRDFRLFIIGHFLSFTGSWVQTTALHWIIYGLNKSSSELGLYSFITTFPSIFATLIAGFLIDRFPRKKLLQTLLTLALFPPLFLFLLVHHHLYNFWVLAFIGLFSSLLASMDMPLRQVFISELVPTRYLTQALSLQAFSFNSARMLGPIIAGLIMSYYSLSLCFFINFLSFLPLLLFTYFINPRFIMPKSRVNRKLNEEFLNLINFLRKRGEILLILTIVATFTFFATSVIILLPMLTLEILKGNAKEFAFLSSGVGIGAILGALTVFLKREPFHEINQLIKAHVLWFLGVLGLIFAKTFPICFISVMLIGMAFTNFYPVANGLLQKMTVSEVRGKVMSLFSVAFLGMAPFGQLFVGLSAEKLPLPLLLTLLIVFFLPTNLYILLILRRKVIYA
uniref:MFS transporter n=1 Tax=Caldimicrobium thiodismutans TaxID=1653476 RepID=A0A832GND9_9BACT